VPIRELVRNPPRRLQLTGEYAARPLIWLANSPEAAGPNGTYYDGFTKNATVNPQANDADLATRLWQTILASRQGVPL
jgi:hypothetical protein